MKYKVSKIALLIAIVCIAIFAGALSAQDEDPEESSREDGAPPTPEELLEQNKERLAYSEAPEIELAPDLRVLIRPTMMGLVPPSDPEGYGEVMLRVRDVNAAGMALFFEVKRSVLKANAAEVNSWREKYETKIVRGDINCGTGSGGEAYICPLLWPAGDWDTKSRLIWLGAGQLTALKRGESIAWGDGRPQTTDEQLGEDIAGGITDFLGGAPAGMELELTHEDTQYPCIVNGSRVMLPAIRTRDTAGLAEYWFLDQRDNPMMLKLSYLMEAENGESVGGNADEGLDFITAGGGFAIIEINF